MLVYWQGPTGELAQRWREEVRAGLEEEWNKRWQALLGKYFRR
jgi:hypothetical protein